jgi:hypothetical protein
LALSVDEELDILADGMRRLKVEYEVYFNGGSKRPPADLEWRVQNLIKKFSDTQKLSFSQLFRYNALAQRYAIFSELWRQKMKIKEAGFSRPQQARLAIQGLRTIEERAAERALQQVGEAKSRTARAHFLIADAGAQPERVRALFEAMLMAKRRAGEANPQGSFDGFLMFIQLKTEQIRREFGCPLVEYRIDLRHDKVRLTARAKK